MSNSNEILYGVISHVEEASDVNVVVATAKRRDDPVSLYRLGLSAELAEDFRDAALAALPDTEDEVILVPYAATYRPLRHELLYIDLEEVPEVAALVDVVSDVSSAEQFVADDSLVRQLRFYASVIEEDGEEAVFFRSYSPKKELTRRGGFAAIFSDGVFQKVTHKTFLFDEDADCFAWGGYMFIRHIAAFHRIFRYFEALKEHADATLDTVLQHVPVANAEEFREACKGQLQMLAKLVNISTKPYLPNLTMEAIEATIATVGLDVEIVTEDGQKKLVFDSATQVARWGILKLLDDDYLKSLLTDELYEASSKIQLS